MKSWPNKFRREGPPKAALWVPSACGSGSPSLSNVTQQMTRWRWRQQLSLRASTLVLLYLVLLYALGMVNLHLVQIPKTLERILGASESTAWGLLLFAALFALAFFMASLAKRQPQLQYLVEFALASGLYVFLPVY